jgi:hypothetical protein
MTVHSTRIGALEGVMQTCPSPETFPIEAGDVKWVAGLFDTMREGDLDAVAEQSDDVAHRVLKAVKARRMLATVDPTLLTDGLSLQRARTGPIR